MDCPRGVFAKSSNTFTIMPCHFWLLFTWRTDLLSWMNKSPESFCGMSKHSAARPSVYHVVIPQMLKPGIELGFIG